MPYTHENNMDFDFGHEKPGNYLNLSTTLSCLLFFPFFIHSIIQLNVPYIMERVIIVMIKVHIIINYQIKRVKDKSDIESYYVTLWS